MLIAFDGMDKEILDGMNCTHIEQKEFGTIDNTTDSINIKTSELFASFITGEPTETHGIIGLRQHDRSPIYNVYRRALHRESLENIKGFIRFRKTLKSILGFDKPKYSKEDLNSKTFFEKVDRAKPLFVPSYNPDPRWQIGMTHRVIAYDGRDRIRHFTEQWTNSRLEDFWDLSHDFWNLVMLHLHDPDPQQDLELGNYEKDYRRLESVAEEIKEEFDEKWTIIFMSDHGLPTENGHNENAFYSCNRELFPNKTPKITDFHDKILEIVEE